MKRFLTPLVYCTLPLMVLSGMIACSSPESQTKTWEENKKILNDQSTRFPNFKVVLAADLVLAQGIWTKATAEADEKKKLKLMKEANFTLSEVSGNLYTIETKLTQLQRRIDDLVRMRLREPMASNRDLMLNNARRIQTQVGDQLSKRPMANHEDAKRFVLAQKSLLTSQSNRLSKAATRFRKSKSSVKKNLNKVKKKLNQKKKKPVKK